MHSVRQSLEPVMEKLVDMDRRIKTLEVERGPPLANLSSDQRSGHITIDLSNFGAVPGILDPSQKGRILSSLNSEFYLSAPSTASSLHAATRLAVEVNPLTRQSRWTHVPPARRDEGIQNEGMWPREVDLCG